jgi:hypothetical protein
MPNAKALKIEKLNAPTSFTDGIHIACRNDGLVLIQFFNKLPVEAIETHRTMMTVETAKKLLESLQSALKETTELIKKQEAGKNGKE